MDFKTFQAQLNRVGSRVYSACIEDWLHQGYETIDDVWRRGPAEDVIYLACTPGVLSLDALRKFSHHLRWGLQWHLRDTRVPELCSRYWFANPETREKQAERLKALLREPLTGEADMVFVRTLLADSLLFPDVVGTQQQGEEELLKQRERACELLGCAMRYAVIARSRFLGRESSEMHMACFARWLRRHFAGPFLPLLRETVFSSLIRGPAEPQESRPDPGSVRNLRVSDIPQGVLPTGVSRSKAVEVVNRLVASGVLTTIVHSKTGF